MRVVIHPFYFMKTALPVSSQAQLPRQFGHPNLILMPLGQKPLTPFLVSRL